jgi:DNA-binding response OmpR family regulator
MNKILLIDDDEELCDLVKEYLTVEGFEVEPVHDGQRVGKGAFQRL